MVDRRIIYAILTAGLVVLNTSCIPANQSSKKTTPLRFAVEYATLEANSLSGFVVDSNLPLGTSADAVLALSQSGLGRSFASTIATKTATELGVLPQILAPSVRAEIQSNGTLASLQGLGALGSALLGQFASDTALADKVRTGLTSKLTQGLSSYGGTTLGSRVQYNFDHFNRLNKNESKANAYLQAANWNLIWSYDGLWTGGTALDGIDHGLQLLGILRCLSEWTYVAGLGSTGDVSPYGGLMKKWNEAATAPAKPMAISDPTLSEMVFTGDLVISLPANVSALNLATQGGEAWQLTATNLTLLEQSAIWMTGAKAFGRMRADRRTKTTSLYDGGTPVLSANAAKLPLLFLNNMGKMLDGPFINSNTQKIFMTACTSGSCPSADAKSIARLVGALSEWILATEKIEASGLDTETAGKIAAALPKLKNALQLAVRFLSGEMTSDETSGSDHWLNVLVASDNGSDPASVSAEVIGTMARVERITLNSDLLKLRITALANAHARKYFSTKGVITSKESALWNARMIQELESSKIAANLPWLNTAKEAFKRSLGADWVGK